MDEQKLRGLIGLSVRAGLADFGTDGCLKSIRSGKAAVLILDEELSATGRDKLVQAAAHHGVPTVEAAPGLIAAAGGREAMTLALRPGGLADQVLRLAQGDQPMLMGGAHVDHHKGKQKEISCGGAGVSWRT